MPNRSQLPDAPHPSWTIRKLTAGTGKKKYHSHSYYDINVFDYSSSRIVGYQSYFSERSQTPDDEIAIGIVDLSNQDQWIELGKSRAWSWQQGPMAQWVPGKNEVIWNDRSQGHFVTRHYSLDTGVTRTLERPSYAIDPTATFTLCLNMARLDELRPGYGYCGGTEGWIDSKHPRDDGVWRQNLQTGNSELILSIDRAVRYLWKQSNWKSYLRHKLKRYHYWFNHVKISPNGKRFTIKLRFKEFGKGWNDKFGVSLTCDIDGRRLNLLADATSHVIWLDNSHLYLWQRDGFYIFRDDKQPGNRTEQLGAGFLEKNSHLRFLPGTASSFVFDTPYRENIDLFLDTRNNNQPPQKIAGFIGHLPANGKFRCDLHPCPSPGGDKIVVTSLQDGGRQIYLLKKQEACPT